MITVKHQIKHQRNRLRQNKYERSILESLQVIEKHFSENQTGDNIIIVLPPEDFKEFIQFQNLRSLQNETN
jgi:hypothetical protein